MHGLRCSVFVVVIEKPWTLFLGIIGLHLVRKVFPILLSVMYILYAFRGIFVLYFCIILSKLIGSTVRTKFLMFCGMNLLPSICKAIFIQTVIFMILFIILVTVWQVILSWNVLPKWLHSNEKSARRTQICVSQ